MQDIGLPECQTIPNLRKGHHHYHHHNALSHTMTVQQGVLCRCGYTVIQDNTLVLDQNRWPIPAPSTSNATANTTTTTSSTTTNTTSNTTTTNTTSTTTNTATSTTNAHDGTAAITDLYFFGYGYDYLQVSHSWAICWVFVILVWCRHYMTLWRWVGQWGWCHVAYWVCGGPNGVTTPLKIS